MLRCCCLTRLTYSSSGYKLDMTVGSVFGALLLTGLVFLGFLYLFSMFRGDRE